MTAYFRLRRRPFLAAAFEIRAALDLEWPFRRSASYMRGRFSERFHFVPGMVRR
jgi:hypothetical protein